MMLWLHADTVLAIPIRRVGRCLRTAGRWWVEVGGGVVVGEQVAVLHHGAAQVGVPVHRRVVGVPHVEVGIADTDNENIIQKSHILQTSPHIPPPLYTCSAFVSSREASYPPHTSLHTAGPSQNRLLHDIRYIQIQYSIETRAGGISRCSLCTYVEYIVFRYCSVNLVIVYILFCYHELILFLSVSLNLV